LRPRADACAATRTSAWFAGFREARPVELRAHFRGAALQAELFRRLEDPGVAGPNRTTGGAYAQASYFVLPHILQVAARLVALSALA